MTTIEQRIQGVQQRIDKSCQSCRRDTTTVQLLAVSKTYDVSFIQEAMLAGQYAFGENYVQEGIEKIQLLADFKQNTPLEWHFIGPLQSNKTALVAENFDWVHSIDRLKIAQRLNDQRPSHLPPLQVCLQVNTDGGANKSGITDSLVNDLALAVAQLPRLQLRGLMAIPEPYYTYQETLASHLLLKKIFDRLNTLGLNLDTLSMGMSADLEAAIEAGSTMVRVGSAIFGVRATKI
jgi:pyridoxal phosphate enzyme (YggS family)